MEKLKDEASFLQQTLSTGQPAVVWKIFPNDADKLKERYDAMFATCKDLQQRTDV